MNRIKTAINTNANYNLDLVNYDKNGNITALKREGHTNTTATTFGMMDDLTYSYDAGNKLVKVEDIASIEGFKNGANTPTEYTYDQNGNMLTDANKGITNILYNHLNLPATVTFLGTNKKIDYIYDAVGTKLKKLVTDGGSLTTTEYSGNYIYENGVLQFFNHAEGYAEPTTAGSFKYVYQYKDHLGNIRLSYKDVSTTSTPILQILEENNYYPFGLQHKGYNNVVNGTENKYQTYQGKEEEKELGKNTYAFGWRDYDPAIGRFNKIDRFAEKYQSMTPYHFTANNPVKFIDLNGDYITVGIFDDNGKQVYSVLYEDGKAYHYTKDNDGNITKGEEYDGDLANKDKEGNITGYKGDLGKTVNSLNELSEKSKTARGIISSLQESKHITEIKPNSSASNSVRVDLEKGDRFGALNNNAYFWQAFEDGTLVNYAPFNQIGSNNRVIWNPSTGLVGLGHELAHAFDAISGFLDSRIIKINGGLEEAREVRATYYENLIRKDLGKGLRKRYTNYGPKLIDENKSPLNYVNPLPTILLGQNF